MSNSTMSLADAQALAASFIESRRALHGNLRMEDDSAAAAKAAAEKATADQAAADKAAAEKAAAEAAPSLSLTPDEIAELLAARDERDALKQAQMSEADKVKDAAQKAEARAVKAERDVARYKIAAEKGVPASLLAGDDEKAMRASADALIAFAKTGKPTGTPKSDPSQGAGDKPVVSSADEGRAEAQRRAAARQKKH